MCVCLADQGAHEQTWNLHYVQIVPCFISNPEKSQDFKTSIIVELTVHR